ncbi:TPA: hypothetical protein DD449_03145 [Candidatus Berkelbacteria bacterium]|uniref:Fimbrial assembly family protein, type IV pilus assembly protein PilN n=1 Tax=Berkelbacteria bacterium GW2011_GWE1_39_12 TaxID=1618337 RepID=A0A0G4B2H5_9BACT|nr:MAG: hypothetical protein UT28_C0001G0258 [Berkelbacteria bacterium GW2011_GWE1_39_12]HBO60654.1 hypothetical protein [Candidatus Berkelbacteria bacterium]
MININLLPPDIKIRAKKTKQSASVFGICLVVLIFLGVTAFLLNNYKTSILQAELDTNQADLTRANQSLGNFNELQKKAIFLNDRAQLATTIENSRSPWSAILQELINSVPTNVQFVSLNGDLTKAPNFTLQGTTDSERDAIKFKDKLESSTYFKDVAFKSSSASAAGSNTGLSFSLEFNLEHVVKTSKAAK